MEILQVENVIFKKDPVTLKMAQSEIEVDNPKGRREVKKEQIKNIEIFRSKNNFGLRIYFVVGENEVSEIIDLCNIPENYINKIKLFATEAYGISVSTTELETLCTTEGNLIYSNGAVTLHTTKPVFSIPKSEIEKIVEIENDMQFTLTDGMDLVLTTNSNVHNFLQNKVSEEVCVIGNVSCINPRSKSTLIFFDDYLITKGSSYDHRILYDNINTILFLETEVEQYMILKLNNPIFQGQTKYEGMVFLLDDKEIEVAAKGSRLKEYYKAKQPEVVLEVMENMADRTAVSSELYFKCSHKINDGYLFIMSDSLQFLPKSITIPTSSIHLVEFSRLNISSIHTKTFDMTVQADKVYVFIGLGKSKYAQLEEYFNKNGVKMIQEVIDEDYSSEGFAEDDDDEDISDIIAEDDE